MIGLVASLVFARLGRLKESCGVALSVMLLMVCMRDMLRDAMLRPYPSAAFAGYAEHAGSASLPLTGGQDAALAFFLACALLAAALIAWLGRVGLSALRRSRSGEGPEA